MLLSGAGVARAAPATLWVQPGISAERARAAAAMLGHGDAAVEPLGALPAAVQVVQVVDRRIEQLCGGPVSLSAWRAEVADGRRALQTLDIDGALASMALAEADLPCVTEKLAPADAFSFFLATAEVHLVASHAVGRDEGEARIQRDSARYAAGRAAAAGALLQPPADTLREAAELLGEVRAGLRGEPPARVVVAGDVGRVWLDGQAMRESVDVLPGAHVVQLTDREGAVVAVELVEVGPGAAVVVWARPDDVPLTRESLEAGVSLLASEGRAPVGLGPALHALDPAFVVTGNDQQLRIFGADDGRVRLRLVDPPDAALQPERRRKKRR
ncbi:MAG: hypothetical protein H6742_02805 [Alphaproteobacteria bacterium]|nr:hypothetical protein [Alphaproteobacteria bacterium]